MKKIILATDFSAVSKVAARYAAEMAVEYKAELMLLNAVHMEGPPRAILKSGSIEDAMVKSAKIECKLLEKELREHAGEGCMISYRVVKGFPTAEIVSEVARAEHADLIVVGTHGSSGVRRILLGSSAAAVINHARVPVIAVPEEGKYRGINSILYATDLLHLEEELHTLAVFSDDFDARVDAVHVSLPGEELDDTQKSVMDRMGSAQPHPRVHFHVVSDESVVDGIDKFAHGHHSDILAFFTHHMNFFEQLFGKSVTRRMTFHASLPLLSFMKKDK